MKKIAIDATTLSDQYKGRGIGTYSKNLIEELIKNRDYEWNIIGFEDVKPQFKKKNINFFSLGEVKLSTPANILFFTNRMRPLIKQINPDLYFAPHFERGLPLGQCKVGVAVHDVSPYLYNKYSEKGEIINFLKGLFYKYNLHNAKKADIIITISEFIKSELVKVGFNHEKILVTALALSKDFDVEAIRTNRDHGKTLRKYSVKKPYLFYYGGLEPNKNVSKLLYAFNLVRKEKEVNLIILDKALYFRGSEIVAETSPALKVKKLIESLNIRRFVILPRFVEWEDLPILHNEALAFVHLSAYEGFGLAVLEALAAGCPVIAADRSCYPEVFGDAALLVDPDNIDLVADSILRVINDKELQRELAEKGREQATKYSWEECGRKTLEAFERTLRK
ncbi:glycosyltransferase family 4 protein [Candidatus Dojkabacteria bacterium]|nr:glycosyltransferase family 4 protein [Candidatus Dojkabacteria bacterium]